MAMPGAGDVDWPELAYDSEPYEPLTTEPEKENTVSNTGATPTGPRYPDVVCDFIGQDGNAFNLLAIVNRALKSYGIEKDEREEFMAEAMAGDYDHLLQTCMKWVTVE